MIGTKHIADLITSPTQFQKGKINIIEAGTSAGKTYFAMNVLTKWAGNPAKILYLIDTNNGEYYILKNDITIDRDSYEFADYGRDNLWGDFAELAKGKMPVMTYAGFGAAIQKSDYPFWKQYEYIICDEIQNLFLYQKFSEDNISLKCAENTLRKIASAGKTVILGLSATPKAAKAGFGALYRNVPFERKNLISFETHNTIFYTGIKQALLENKGKTGIIYTPRIHDMKEIITFAAAQGYRANGFWSLNPKPHKDRIGNIVSDNKMNAEQLAVRQYVLEHEAFPEDLDLLVINKSSETCIKIKDKLRKVDFMVINTTDVDEQTQVRGRYCGDLPQLYLHAREDECVVLEVPPRFLNRELDVEEKAELCSVMRVLGKNGKPLNWTGLKRRLADGEKYVIIESRRNNKRYDTIQELLK